MGNETSRFRTENEFSLNHDPSEHKTTTPVQLSGPSMKRTSAAAGLRWCELGLGSGLSQVSSDKQVQSSLQVLLPVLRLSHTELRPLIRTAGGSVSSMVLEHDLQVKPSSEQTPGTSRLFWLNHYPVRVELQFLKGNER